MADMPPAPVRRHSIRRVLVSGAVGLGVGAVASFLVPWQAAVLLGWVGTAASNVGMVLQQTWRLDGPATEALATREDDSRVAMDILLVSASVVSLVAVGLGLLKAGELDGYDRAGMTAVTMLSVFLAWAVVQSVFTLRYARLYYGGDTGGIEFNEDDPPDYRDFGYLALTIGMTYQVSDTNLGAKPIRRTATRHALLSYLFGTVVVAVMINVVASLLH
jgi:uncharacterized membrane protein